jgi:hypothetical protein
MTTANTNGGSTPSKHNGVMVSAATIQRLFRNIRQSTIIEDQLESWVEKAAKRFRPPTD